MNKDQILKLLKTVSYPGFTRDIVSFGIVEHIQVDKKNVNVVLKVAAAEDKRKTILNAVRKALEDSGVFEKVNVTLVTKVSNQPFSGPDEGIQPNQSIPGVKYVIAVASGKGGVGKSTVAANLAAALCEKSIQVGLLDLDIYGPSLPIILGLKEQPKLTQERKLIPLDFRGMKVMSFGFLSGDDSPAIWRGPLVARMTEQFFRDVVWGELDYLVLDLPPGTGDVQLTLTQKIKISGAVIVTTPQDIALADVRKGANMFRKVQAPILGVIENMSGLRLEGKVLDSKGTPFTNGLIHVSGEESKSLNEKGEFNLLLDLFKTGGGAKESQRLGVPLLGTIPISREIMEATDAGVPIVFQKPNSFFSKKYRDIAELIMESI